MGKSDKKRTKSGRRRMTKGDQAAKPDVIAPSTITLVDLFMGIMRPPRTIAPEIEQSGEIARCEQ